MDPHERYKDFYDNETIQRIGKNRRWSVSTSSKKPVDVGWLRDVMPYVGTPDMDRDPPGARIDCPSSMMTLDEITEFLPNASNLAYYVDAAYDDIVVLDVESHCDPHLRDEALALEALYRERSLSHKGFHMVFEAPADLLDKYPNADRSVVKKKTGDYELHLRHWVTFTRDTKLTIGAAEKARIDKLGWPAFPPSSGGSFEKFITPLFKAQKTPPSKGSHERITLNVDLTEDQWALVRELTYDERTKYKKSLSYFNDDRSRWEYGYINHIISRIKSRVSPIEVCGCVINRRVQADDSAIVKMAYEIAKQLLPYREKHDETRGSSTWLMYQVESAVASYGRR